MSTRKLVPLKLILLVDDDDTTNYLNQRLLEGLNAAEKIIIVKDGEKALDYLTRACDETQSTHYPCPELVFLDIKMPIMDGFEFLDAYQKANLAARQNVIMMMLTSSASFYDLERLKQYPEVKRHYSKSLTEMDVKDLIEEFFPDHVVYLN
jgi:CheY-like chemotaxis protein